MKLIEAASSHLYASFRHFNLYDRAIDPRVWDDKYLLGYAQGSLAFMTLVYGVGFNTEQRGLVFVRAVESLQPENWKSICDRALGLANQKDPEYMLGVKHGSYVSMLMGNKPTSEMLADPDVQQALREGPSATEALAPIRGPSEGHRAGVYGTAGAVLMLNYLRQHKPYFEAGIIKQLADDYMSAKAKSAPI